MKSVFKVSLAALTTAFAVSSHAANKTLVVATDTAFVPFEFKQGDKYVGFDVDLWAAIAKELKLDYTLKPMDFSGIIRRCKPKISIWRWRGSPLPTSVKSDRLLRRLLQKRPAGDGQRQ